MLKVTCQGQPQATNRNWHHNPLFVLVASLGVVLAKIKHPGVMQQPE